MFFIKTYFYKILKYDLVNAFYYKNLMQVPRIEKMILNFGYQKSNFKYLISSLLALEFLSTKKGKITKSKHLNIFLKIMCFLMTMIIFAVGKSYTTSSC